MPRLRALASRQRALLRGVRDAAGATRRRGESAASERQRAARKIKPQYAEGELVKVARARNRAQAEFIAGLLLEEGIPSVLRSSFGAAIGGYASARARATCWSPSPAPTPRAKRSRGERPSP